MPPLSGEGFSTKPKLKSFNDINKERCESSKGFNMPLDEWPLAHFALGICGEAGEIAEIVKKLERGFNARERKKFLDKLKKTNSNQNLFNEDGSLAVSEDFISSEWVKGMESKLSLELADVYTYLDLMATAIKSDLKTMILMKFNMVSEDMNCFEDFHIDFTNQI